MCGMLEVGLLKENVLRNNKRERMVANLFGRCDQQKSQCRPISTL